MLWQQTIHFLCNRRNLAKFIARILIVWVADGRPRYGLGEQFFNCADETRGIRLESAAWVFHMICVT